MVGTPPCFLRSPHPASLAFFSQASFVCRLEIMTGGAPDCFLETLECRVFDVVPIDNCLILPISLVIVLMISTCQFYATPTCLSVSVCNERTHSVFHRMCDLLELQRILFGCY